MRSALPILILATGLAACGTSSDDASGTRNSMTAGTYRLSHQVYYNDDGMTEATSDVHITATGETAISFTIEAVGSYGHFCELDGEALREPTHVQPLYVYRGEECTISFTLVKNGVKLQASGQHDQTFCHSSDLPEAACGVNSYISSGTYLDPTQP
jgi:hypothetical protein